MFSAVISPFVTFFIIFFKIFFPARIFLRLLRRFISWYGLIIIKCLLFPFIKVKFSDVKSNDTFHSCIFICNHRSSSDPYLLSCLPYEIVQVVNDWPFRIPVLGFVAKLAGYISIKDIEKKNFFEIAGKLLEQGVCIAGFPEGTRSGSNKMGQFYGSLFRLALEIKCPIVPICIIGNEKIPTRNFVIHSGTIFVKKLQAIRYEEYKGMSSYKLKNYVRDIIVKETARMEMNNE